MKTISRRAYAKHRGVGESAVRKAISSGRIAVEEDGKINPEKADAQWEQNTASKDVKITPKHQSKNNNKKEPPAPVDLDESKPTENNTESYESGIDEEPALNNKTTFSEARTANEILKAQMQKIKLAELKKEVVNRRLAEAHIFQLAREERDAWQRWPSRIAAEMSSQLNLDQHALHTLLDKYVREHLSELAEVKPQFNND